MARINEYAPILTNGQDGFTVLARNESMARKEILLSVDAADIDRIDLVGSRDLDDYETQDILDLQDYY